MALVARTWRMRELREGLLRISCMHLRPIYYKTSSLSITKFPAYLLQRSLSYTGKGGPSYVFFLLATCLRWELRVHLKHAEG